MTGARNKQNEATHARCAARTHGVPHARTNERGLREGGRTRGLPRVFLLRAEDAVTGILWGISLFFCASSIFAKAVFLFETTRDEVRKIAPAQFYVLCGLHGVSWSDFSTQNIVLALRLSSNTKWRFQVHTTRALLSYFFANAKRSEKNTK